MYLKQVFRVEMEIKEGVTSQISPSPWNTKYGELCKVGIRGTDGIFHDFLIMNDARSELSTLYLQFANKNSEFLSWEEYLVQILKCSIFNRIGSSDISKPDINI